VCPTDARKITHFTDWPVPLWFRFVVQWEFPLRGLIIADFHRAI